MTYQVGFGIAGIVLVFLLLICFGVVKSYAHVLRKKKENLIEAYWARRNKLPLYIEVLKRGNLDRTITDKLTSLHGQLQMENESKLTDLLLESLKQGDGVSAFKSDALYLSLKKELQEGLGAIYSAENDYQQARQKWLQSQKQPWFKIWGFALKDPLI